MRYSPRHILKAVPALALALALGALLAPGAAADGSTALYRASVSFSCNKPSICGPNLGGFRGSVVFNSDGTAHAELVNVAHVQGGGPAAGAQHFSAVIAGTPQQPGWYIAPSPELGGLLGFWLTNETDTFTGRSGGSPQTVVIPVENFDTGVPAVPGHYSSRTMYGMSAPPGTNFEVQVTGNSGR